MGYPQAVILTVIGCLLSTSLATFNPPVYKQYDPLWANDTIGFSNSTIQQVGCLLTSVTSILAGEGILINNEVPTPPILNGWLKDNNGYVDNDDFVWDSVSPFGVEFLGFVTTPGDIIAALQVGKIPVLNVHAGRHYVLCLGTNGIGFNVMDPGYRDVDSYLFSDVVKAGIYSYNAQ